MDTLDDYLLKLLYKYSPKIFKTINKKFYSFSNKLIISNKIPDVVFNKINPERIRNLTVYNNIFIKDDDIKKMINLKHLNLSSNKNITNNGIKDLNKISTLCLFDNNNITDDGIKNLKNLKYLDIRNMLIKDNTYGDLISEELKDELKKRNVKIITLKHKNIVLY